MTPEEAERVYCIAARDAAGLFEAAAERIELEAGGDDGPDARVMVSDLLRAAEEFVRIHHEGPWTKRPRPSAGGRRHDDVPEIPDTAEELIRLWEEGDREAD